MRGGGRGSRKPRRLGRFFLPHHCTGGPRERVQGPTVYGSRRHRMVSACDGSPSRGDPSRVIRTPSWSSPAFTPLLRPSKTPPLPQRVLLCRPRPKLLSKSGEFLLYPRTGVIDFSLSRHSSSACCPSRVSGVRRSPERTKFIRRRSRGRRDKYKEKVSKKETY